MMSRQRKLQREAAQLEVGLLHFPMQHSMRPFVRALPMSEQFCFFMISFTNVITFITIFSFEGMVKDPEQLLLAR